MFQQKDLEQLQQQYRRYRLQVFLVLGALIAAVIFIFINRYVTLVCVALAAFFQVFWLRRKQHGYTDGITRINIESTTCRYLGASETSQHSGGAITADTVTAAGMMPFRSVKGSPLFCWGITGSRENLPISVCDATFAQDFTLVKKGRHRVHFNSGAWVHIELPVHTGQCWCLMDDTSVPTPIRMDYFAGRPDMETALFDDINEKVARRCVLYRPKGQPDMRPDARVLLQVEHLMDYTTGYPAISLNDNQLDVFLRARFLARPVSMATPPTKELLDFEPLPELTYLVRLAKLICQ